MGLIICTILYMNNTYAQYTHTYTKALSIEYWAVDAVQLKLMYKMLNLCVYVVTVNHQRISHYIGFWNLFKKV